MIPIGDGTNTTRRRGTQRLRIVDKDKTALLLQGNRYSRKLIFIYKYKHESET